MKNEKPKNSQINIYLANGVLYEVYHNEEITDNIVEELDTAIRKGRSFWLGNWSNIEIHCKSLHNDDYLFRPEEEDITIPASQIIGYNFI